MVKNLIKNKGKFDSNEASEISGVPRSSEAFGKHGNREKKLHLRKSEVPGLPGKS